MEEDGVELSGRTVEDAVAQAEATFSTSRDELTIDILTQGRSGVFGIGAENARIRVRRPQPVAAAIQEAPRFATAGDSVSAASESESVDVPGMPAASAMEQESIATESVSGVGLPSEAADVLRELLLKMGFDAEVTVRSTDDPLMLEITGTNLGMLIGRRGDNLAALQFIVNLMLSKNRRQWPRIVIDVENYRARREESLRSLADRIAYRVRDSQRPFTLEAMPAGDRRVIHVSLRDESDIETFSIGEGIARRVVIAPKRAQEHE